VRRNLIAVNAAPDFENQMHGSEATSSARASIHRRMWSPSE